MIENHKIEAYLGDVRAHLGSATASEEEDVIRELNSRIHDLAAQTGATADLVLEQLGPATKVARGYRDAHLIEKANRSFSPILLLHASLRNGIPGVLAFLVGLAGYWFGGVVVVFGTLALIWSAVHYTANANTAIGSSMLQTALTVVAGIAVLALTTFLLRTMLRTSKRVRPYL